MTRSHAWCRRSVRAHPRIRVEARAVDRIPGASLDHPVIIATGPLTGDELATDLARTVGRRAPRLLRCDRADRRGRVDRHGTGCSSQSRWGKGGLAVDDGGRDAAALGDEAYINCPFDEAGYRAFVRAVVAAEKVVPRAFEDVRYFEGCLPIEVMASRGEMTLAFGPMKPVGLTDPSTGRRPFAVVQLRPEDEGATAYNLVGFQTRMTYAGAGARLPDDPGPRGVRNSSGSEACTATRSSTRPGTLDERMQLRARPNVFLAGQITGVEGYVESCAGGFLCARTARADTPRAAVRAAAPDHRARGHPDAPRAQGGWIPAVEHHLGVPSAARSEEDEEARSVRRACRARARRARELARVGPAGPSLGGRALQRRRRRRPRSGVVTCRKP